MFFGLTCPPVSCSDFQPSCGEENSFCCECFLFFSPFFTVFSIGPGVFLTPIPLNHVVFTLQFWDKRSFCRTFDYFCNMLYSGLSFCNHTSAALWEKTDSFTNMLEVPAKDMLSVPPMNMLTPICCPSWIPEAGMRRGWHGDSTHQGYARYVYSCTFVAAPAIAPECVCPGSADLVAVMLTVPDSRIVDFPAAATFTAAPHSFYRWAN